MSDYGTSDIRRLANETSRNYRLVAPLVLYAASVEKLPYLRSVAKDDYLLGAAAQFLENVSWKDIVSKLENDCETIPLHYRKVYRSYVCINDRQKAVDHTKLLMYERIKELQVEKSVSTYRLYTDLGLNHGNVNAYIKHGDVSKVSLGVAEKVLEYLDKV